jgi:hypothetical protein
MIPKDLDPVVAELQRICSILQLPASFLLANLFEQNVTLDSFKSEQYPVVVYLTEGENEEGTDKNSYNITRKVPLSLLLLDRYDAPTSDYTSIEVEPTINRMRRLAENLYYEMNKSPLSIGDGGIVKFKTVKLYGKNDAHLYGVTFDGDWTVNTGISGCYH